MKSLPIANIIKISADYLEYKDDDGSVKHISFYECRKNYAEYVNRRTDGASAGKISAEENNCVGERDWFAKHPYYEFFTDERIRFEIVPKKRFSDLFHKYWVQRYYKDFHEITVMLNDVGLTTFDLG